jgi:hypothetical protein
VVSGRFGVVLSLQASGELVQRERSLGLRSLSLVGAPLPVPGGLFTLVQRLLAQSGPARKALPHFLHSPA